MVRWCYFCSALSLDKSSSAIESVVLSYNFKKKCRWTHYLFKGANGKENIIDFDKRCGMRIGDWPS